MSKEAIHDALDLLDNDMIEAVDCLRRKKRQTARNWMKWGSFAACLCIAATAIIASGQLKHTTKDNAGEMEVMESFAESTVDGGATGVYIPRMEVGLGKVSLVQMDMIGFFIYGDRSYVEYEQIAGGENLVGDYAGTAVGTIDEWTKEDGYVELAGSISGDFYTVQGYSPDFMLCMKSGEDDITVFINDNDITLNVGADLFEERLKLKGNYQGVEYQTRSDWYHSKGDPIPISEEYGEVIERFVDAVYEAPFMFTSDIPLREGDTNIYDREIYHLFFKMDTGMIIHLRLFDGGYVRFQGIRDACVQVDTCVFEEMIEALAADR